METDSQRMKYGGLRWLYDSEFVDHPQVINNMKLNILMVSKCIKDAEFIFYREKKSCLILIHLNWWGRTFKKKQLINDVHEVANQLLSTFRFRVTDNPVIMEMAIQNVKRALSGGNNEVSNNMPNLSSSKSERAPSVVGSSTGESTSSVGLQPNVEEQTGHGQDLRQETGTDSSSKG